MTGRVDSNWSRGEVTNIANLQNLSRSTRSISCLKFSAKSSLSTLAGEWKKWDFPIVLHRSDARVRRGQGGAYLQSFADHHWMILGLGSPQLQVVSVE